MRSVPYQYHVLHTACKSLSRWFAVMTASRRLIGVGKPFRSDTDTAFRIVQSVFPRVVCQKPIRISKIPLSA